MVERQTKLSDYPALIKEWEMNLLYPGGGQTPPAFLDFDNDTAFDARDELHQAAMDNIPELIRVDIMALELALTKVHAEYDEEYRKAQPLESWWWHLDKLRARTYPAELLPSYLREIYLAVK